MQDRLLQLLPEAKTNVPLAPYTTFHIGGPARYFFIARQKEDLVHAVEAAKKLHIPLFILGGGSNVLVSDKGFNGLVVKIEIQGIDWKQQKDENVRVCVCAGEQWDHVVALSIEKNLFGVENLSGIPGTMGAAPVQNIGAYGAELKDTLDEVEVFNKKTTQFEKLSADACKFHYRESIFKKKEGESLIISEVSLLLKTNGQFRVQYKDIDRYLSDHQIKNLSLSMLRNIILEIRQRKFPDLREVGTAGSFFKNPILRKKEFQKLIAKFPEMPFYELDQDRVKVPVAWILDRICRLKGKTKGSVGAYERQPLVLINTGNATANEVKEFAYEIIRNVKEKTGISIESEVQLVGKF
ncbi:MAG: UDP-N-acetylmuramate dehydrogenase [Candidatus Wildermuthbacteria bacterium]|nr:UDP-N-acetylmuramate dehydrogenase [Candidatus Wildermuthbacteria bacterium]